MTVSKSILSVSALSFALIFGGGIYVLQHLNTLAKPVSERIASQALGVPVHIGALNISLQDKLATVSDIRISNPPGFSKPHALTIESVQIGLNSIGQKLLDFKTINSTGAQVYVEVKNNTTNLQTLQAGIKGASDTKTAEDPLKVIIREFGLQDVQLNPSLTLIGDKDLDAVQISPILLRNIGTQENGVLARDAVAQIMKPLLKDFTSAAAGAGFYQGLSQEALESLGISQGQILKNQVQDEVNKIGDKVKGLFGGTSP